MTFVNLTSDFLCEAYGTGGNLQVGQSNGGDAGRAYFDVVSFRAEPAEKKGWRSLTNVQIVAIFKERLKD